MLPRHTGKKGMGPRWVPELLIDMNREDPPRCVSALLAAFSSCMFHGPPSSLGARKIPPLSVFLGALSCILTATPFAPAEQTGGEGFGLPAWEAMCSGLPVV
jgi:hypothetical protein